MKRFLLLVTAVVMFGTANAQDVIVLQNAEEIQAKVEAITQNQVTYRRWSNLGGPTYTIDKSQIFYIKYQNGEKDVMTSMTPANRMTSVSRSATAQYSPITFAGYVNLGTIFNADGAGPTFDITAGMKVYDYFYAGIATGFHTVLTPYEYYYYDSYYDYYDKGTLSEAYIPVGVNLKGYFTKGRKVNPYIDCTLGAFIGVGDLGGFNGFHCQVGMGLDIKRFTIGMGYNPLVKYGTAHLGYFKLGYRFGK
jgi:hypothetical protein